MILYADGSAYTVDKSGGWAWYVSDEVCDSGYECPATNNTMEINAVLQGLKVIGPELEWAESDEQVEVVSDSAYVINCMTARWFDKWRVKGWVNSSGEPVANRDLWEQLIKVVEEFPTSLIWTHVRGHGRGKNDAAHHVVGNDKVDRMAGAARIAGVQGVDQDWARADALKILPKKKRRRIIKLDDLQGLVFVTDGGQRWVALDMEEGGTVLLLEEGK